MKKTVIIDRHGSFNQLILESLNDMILYQLADNDYAVANNTQLWIDMSSAECNPIKFLSNLECNYGAI